MKTIFSDKINSEILEKINSFISTGDYNKELEITITQEDVPIKEFLKKYTSLKKNTNNIDYCLLCKNNIKFGEFKRTINKCNHFFHKKCFDKIINISDNVNCIVCNDKFF